MQSGRFFVGAVATERVTTAMKNNKDCDKKLPESYAEIFSTNVSSKKFCRRRDGVLLTAEQLAEELGESSRTIRTWRQKHVIPYVAISYRTQRFVLADVLTALARRTIKPRNV
jgi:DNA-binding transcriptional regulator YiaG